MTLQARIDQVLSQAFSYEEALKMHDRSEADIDELRKLVANDKTIPNCCTDRHVSFSQGRSSNRKWNNLN